MGGPPLSDEEIRNISISISSNVNELIILFHNICNNLIYYHNKILNYLFM